MTSYNDQLEARLRENEQRTQSIRENRRNHAAQLSESEFDAAIEADPGDPDLGRFVVSGAGKVLTVFLDPDEVCRIDEAHFAERTVEALNAALQKRPK